MCCGDFVRSFGHHADARGATLAATHRARPSQERPSNPGHIGDAFPTSCQLSKQKTP